MTEVEEGRSFCSIGIIKGAIMKPCGTCVPSMYIMTEDRTYPGQKKRGGAKNHAAAKRVEFTIDSMTGSGSILHL